MEGRWHRLAGNIELMQKYNIDLKLQIYIHINNSLREDCEKIGLVKIKIYCIYNWNNIMLRSGSDGPEMHAIQLNNKFAVAMVLWDYILINNGPATFLLEPSQWADHVHCTMTWLKTTLAFWKDIISDVAHQASEDNLCKAFSCNW